MLNLMTVKAGARIRLRDGTIREVIENYGDGAWLQARVVESPAAPDQIGTEDMVHCEEIVGLEDSASK